ncbi:RNA binding protein [Aureococcus anophagefferens]|uniref:RNA binding protein n=1 Tax=Aureococcus anophagefferens TaxID=44056 RepID=A0ABR1GD86_AURAN
MTSNKEEATRKYLARRGDSLNAAQRAALAGVAPPAAAGADGDRADKVFVGNLPFSTTAPGSGHVRRYEIKGAKIVADRATNRSKGFGFVTFATEADAAAAVQAFAGVSVEGGRCPRADDPDEPAAPMAHTARAEAAGGDSLDAAEALSPRAAAAALNTGSEDACTSNP